MQMSQGRDLGEHHDSSPYTSAAEPRGPLSPLKRSDGSSPLRRPADAPVRLKPVEPFLTFIGNILSYIVALYLFLAMAQVLSEESVVTCNHSPYKRQANPDALGTAPVSAAVRRFVFVYGVRLVQVVYCSILVALLPSLRRVLFYVYGLIFGAYFLGEAVAEFLKHYSGDFNCHLKHANGVSGHYYFIAFNLYIAIYLGKVLRRSLTFSPYVSLIRLISLFFTVGCLSLEGFFSYYYGYHSVKQIVYGALIGMAFAAGAISGSEYLLANPTRFVKLD